MFVRPQSKVSGQFPNKNGNSTNEAGRKNSVEVSYSPGSNGCSYVEAHQLSSSSHPFDEIPRYNAINDFLFLQKLHTEILFHGKHVRKCRIGLVGWIMPSSRSTHRISASDPNIWPQYAFSIGSVNIIDRDSQDSAFTATTTSLSTFVIYLRDLFWCLADVEQRDATSTMCHLQCTTFLAMKHRSFTYRSTRLFFHPRVRVLSLI